MFRYIFILLFPTILSAETISILRSDPASPIVVETGGTVIVDTQDAFFETVMANPSVADHRNLTSREIQVTGTSIGRTTLTILGADGVVIHADVLVQANATKNAPPVLTSDMTGVEVMDIVNGQSPDVVRIFAGGAIVIRTDVPIRDLGTSSAGIVMFSSIAADSFYIIGAQPGMTELLLMRDDKPDTTIMIETVAY